MVKHFTKLVQIKRKGIDNCQLGNMAWENEITGAHPNEIGGET